MIEEHDSGYFSNHLQMQFTMIFETSHTTVLIQMTVDRVGYTLAPEGKPLNVSIGNLKKGKNDDVLFSRPGYNTIDDTYQDPDKLIKYGYRNGINSSPEEFTAWKNNDQVKTV